MLLDKPNKNLVCKIISCKVGESDNYFFLSDIQMGNKKLEQKIDNDSWTLYDKIVYGGLGYGNICLPTHIFDIIFTVIFPPLGIIIKHLDFLDHFPYIHWDTFTALIRNIHELVMSFILTACFYVPGLVYTLDRIRCDV